MLFTCALVLMAKTFGKEIAKLLFSVELGQLRVFGANQAIVFMNVPMMQQQEV
ncbi:MAG: hypothetical protein IT215_04520 [Chitinophagaceae bacterium]|nr:hypothetical protein [Chitinophagaceae bacterium]